MTVGLKKKISYKKKIMSTSTKFGIYRQRKLLEYIRKVGLLLEYYTSFLNYYNVWIHLVNDNKGVWLVFF